MANIMSNPTANPTNDLTAENWWEMTPGRTEGAAKLLKRCIELLAWRVDFAMNVLYAYKDFLECKAFIKDWDGTRLEPSVPVYQMWNQHILDTCSYAPDCELLYGQVIHYNPNHYKDPQGRNERVSRTMKLIAERNGVQYLDPMVWNYGHHGYMPPMPAPVPSSAGADGTPSSTNKRPRQENGEGGARHPIGNTISATPTANEPREPQLPAKAHAAEIFAVIPSPKPPKKRSLPEHVTLRIYKTADGGAMDNKVTLHRNQELRTVLNYYRYRCLWRNNLRLNLHYTPNELNMGAAENIVLATIHVEEIVTMWFLDWKDGSHSRHMKMGDTFTNPFEYVAKNLGLDKSKLGFSFKGSELSESSTPMLFQLDHGDQIDVHLFGPVDEATNNIKGESKEGERKEEHKEETKVEEEKEREDSVVA